MEKAELTNKLCVIEDDTNFRIIYQKNINGYKKITSQVVQLGDYYLKTGKPKPTIKKPTNDIYLGNHMTYNMNTGRTRLQVFPQADHKRYVSYEYNGEDIDMETYYANSGDKVSAPTIVFSIDIENIIAILP